MRRTSAARIVSATSRRAACSAACSDSRLPVCSAANWVSSPAPSGSTNTPWISRERLVARRAVDRPGRGQRLPDAQDLLDDQPAVRPDGRPQPPRVAAGVRQPVRVVHAQAVDRALVDPAEDLGVRGREHLGVLHAHRGQRGHVEEAPVGQLGRAALPGAEPVVLALVHLLRGAALGAGRHGRGVLVVVQLGPVVGQGELARAPSPRRRPAPGAGSARRPSRCRSTSRTPIPSRAAARPTTTGSPANRRRRRGWARCRARSPARARGRRPRARATPPGHRAPRRSGWGPPRRSRGWSPPPTPAAATRTARPRPARRGRAAGPAPGRRSGPSRTGCGRSRTGRGGNAAGPRARGLLGGIGDG